MEEVLPGVLLILGFICAAITNYFVLRSCMFASGTTIRSLSTNTNKMPNIRKLLKEYKDGQVKEPKLANYLKWLLISFRLFYMSWTLAVLLLIIFAL